MFRPVLEADWTFVLIQGRINKRTVKCNSCWLNVRKAILGTNFAILNKKSMKPSSIIFAIISPRPRPFSVNHHQRPLNLFIYTREQDGCRRLTSKFFFTPQDNAYYFSSSQGNWLCTHNNHLYHWCYTGCTTYSPALV